MRPRLSALSLVGLFLCASALGAQARLQGDSPVRASPTGNVVATLRRNTQWANGASRDGHLLIVIQGWVEGSRFGGPRDDFDATIGGSSRLRIREEPSLNGRILGEFEPGAGVHVLERRANWARIRREVWVPLAAATLVNRPATAATPTSRPTAPAARPAPATTSPAAGDSQAPAQGAVDTIQPPRGSAALRASSHAQLRLAPSGEAVGELQPGAVVEARGRDRGWVKIRVEAWVAESLFVPADTAFGATLTAADLRLDPQGMRGRLVRWEVQVVGLQTADPLRRDMARDEPFLLAMGPTGEDAILYIAVPPELLAQARAIPAMERVLLTARVRTGRSNPTGAPILDLVSLIRR
jgi:hypothetical protein